MTPVRPRVLHVGKFYPPAPGGMEQVVANLCRATNGRLANEVLVFNDGRGTRREIVDGVPVTRLGSVAAARSTPIAPAMLGALRQNAADLVVLHEPNPWALLACAIAKPRQPLAVFFHSEVVRPRVQYALFYHPLVRTVYARAASIIVTSPTMAECAAALAPYRDRITVVPLGIDLDRWTAFPAIRTRSDEIRAAQRGRPLVLFTGRLVAYKGCDVLLRALEGLDVGAVIAGDGPQRAALAALAARAGLADRVRFAGEVPHEELVALYHAADLFVLPSVTRAEAFGLVQLEAMACGLPVVSTRLPTGVPWVNRHGETGLTVDPGDHAALRAAIAALAGDPGLRTRMGAAGKARVAREFSIERMGDRAAALFEALASGPAAAGDGAAQG